MKTTRSLLRTIFFKPLAVILAAVITLFIFSIAILLLPLGWIVLFVYRKIVILIAKFKLPNGRILEMADSMMSFGTEYTSTHFYVTVQFILEGYLSVDEVRESWTEVCNKLNANGELQYPELQDYLHYFGGYAFRRPIKDFDAKKYTRCHEEPGNSMVDKLKLLEIRKKIHAKLFKKHDPLWEITIVNNYRHNNSEQDHECTAFILKFQHTLCDGIGAVNVLYVNVGGSPLEPQKLDKSTCSYKYLKVFRFFYGFIIALVLMFNTVLNSINSRSFSLNTHDWHVKGQKFPTKFELWLAEPISKKIFREIKSVCNISTMSVLVNVVAGGMRRMMLAKGLKPPKDMRVTFPLPGSNHPGTLTNRMLSAVFRVPLSIDDCKKRIVATDGKIKSSFVNLILMKFGYKFGEVLPNCLKSGFGYDVYNSLLFACTPLPSIEAKIFGHKQLSCSSVVASDRTTCGCLVSILGLMDHFHASIQMNSSLLSHPNEVRDLEKYMLEELDFIGKTLLT